VRLNLKPFCDRPTDDSPTVLYYSPSMPFSYVPTPSVRNKYYCPRTFYRSAFTYSGRLPKLLTTIKMLMHRTLVNDKSSSSSNLVLQKRPIRRRWHPRLGRQMTHIHFLPFLYAGAININRCRPINTCDGDDGPASVSFRKVFAITIAYYDIYDYCLRVIIETRNSVKSVGFPTYDTTTLL